MSGDTRDGKAEWSQLDGEGSELIIKRRYLDVWI